jgi:hypothetical protein
LFVERLVSARLHGQAVLMQRVVLGAGTELECDVGHFPDGRHKCRLQVGAMDHPIGRAITPLGRFAERHALDRLPRCGADLDRLRRDRVRAQPLGKPEVGQNASRVGRQLDASAGFLQPRGLFQHDHPIAGARNRERGGQSADPGSCDDDGSGTRHAPVP